MVVVTTTGTVVVVAGAGGIAVGTFAACVDVSAVAAVAALAGAAAGAVVVVVDVVVVRELDDEVAPPAVPRARCESLDGALAIPSAPPPPPPAPRATRFGLPAVATSSAIRARETARMTHQLGRLRATPGRRSSVV